MKVDNFVSNRLQNYISKFLLQLGPPKRSILATPLQMTSLMARHRHDVVPQLSKCPFCYHFYFILFKLLPMTSTYDNSGLLLD